MGGEYRGVKGRGGEGRGWDGIGKERDGRRREGRGWDRFSRMFLFQLWHVCKNYLDHMTSLKFIHAQPTLKS